MKHKDLRLLLSIGSSRNLFVASLFAGAIWSAIIVANGFLVSSIIVGIIESRPNVSLHLIQLTLLWLFRSFFQSQFEKWSGSQAIYVKSELRKRLVEKMGSFRASPTEVSTLAIKGLNSLDTYIGRFLPQMIFATTTPVVVIATILFLDPTSGIIAILTLPLIPIFGALIGMFTSDAVAKKWRELGSLAKYFEDSMRGFVTLRLFGRHRTQSQRITLMGKKYTDETMKVLRISFLSSLVLELCATISVALIAVSIGIRLVDGSLDFFPSLTILILAPEVYFPLRNAATLFHASVDGTQAMETLNSLEVNKETERTSELSWKRWSSPFLGIEIPEGFISAGDCRVLMGESGIGKTTFTLSLLNSLEISEVAWIPQNPTLARGSLRDQFRLVNPAISDEEIIQLCHKVNLDIAELPVGLETPLGGIGEKSSRASGGQMRKIAIARSLAKRSRILIADEPTADLDRASAMQVAQLLRNYVQMGGALLVITHDQEFDDMKKIEVEYLER